MTWEQRAVVPLRICLVVLFGILVVFQTLSLPGQLRHLAHEHPEDADLRWPLTAVAVFLVLVAGAVLGLLMVVMRALLRQATTLRTDMEAVI